MVKGMNIEERFELIVRNLEEVIGEKEMLGLLREKNEVCVYWGTMPTGSPHVSYYVPLLKIADFLKAGLRVKILIADLHAALDGVPWGILDKRQRYYELLIPLMLKTLGVDVSKLEFVRGSKIQLNPKYFEDVLKLSTIASVRDATKAASEVVKKIENPNVSGLVYPIMMALDEEYLGVDIQFGGTDQRKIFVFAREFLPKLGYKARVELMNPMVPGLIGKKMSSSVEGSKIDMTDSEEIINKKINGAVCEEGNPDNGLMGFLKYVIMVMKKDAGKKFKVERAEKFGGNVEYSNYEQLEKDFVAKKLHPMDLKKAVAQEINALVEPVRKDRALIKAYKEAYS